MMGEIERVLQEEQDGMVAFLADLVRAESPTSDRAAQAGAQRLLREAWEALGFRVTHRPGTVSGGSLLIEMQAAAGRPRQLLLGHCDTVWAIGTIQTMPLEIDGEMMRGPGVFDMKAGLTQMVFALRALRTLGLEPAVSPVVLINSDEETGSDESREPIERLARGVDRVFVLEPSLGREGRLKTARKGVAHYRLTTRGVASHAGLDPEKGRSAILAMAAAVQKLHAMADLPRGISVNVGVIAGGTRSNVVAAECRAEVDMRGLTLDAMARIDRQIQALRSEVDGVALVVEGGINRPPLERTAGNRRLWELAREIGREMGLDLEQGTAGGGSDGNLTSPFAPTLDGLGAAGDGAHAAHEFIYIDSLVERTALLARLLLAPPLGQPGE